MTISISGVVVIVSVTIVVFVVYVTDEKSGGAAGRKVLGKK